MQIYKRQFENEINYWYQNQSDNPLIVSGVRQCGKTTTIINWCQTHNLNFFYLNFMNENQYIDLFNQAKSANQIIKYICSLNNLDLDKLELIFLDEIQVDANLLYLTRLFKNHKVKLICSGSLLGLRLKNKPNRTDVGSSLILEMYPLNFYEFLIWNNYEYLTEEINQAFNTFKQLNPLIHNKLIDLYYQFLITGGMPEVVNLYLKNHGSFNKVIYDKKKAILNDYINDNNQLIYINNEIRKSTINVMNLIYNHIHNFIINPNNKRFMINTVNKSYRFKNIELPLDVLKQSKLVLMVQNTKAISYPLNLHLDESIFKLYYSDVGLLTSILGLDENSLLLYRTENKNSSLWGGVIENATICSLNSSNLYYHRFNINNHIYEVDLLIEDVNDDLIPIEIKSKSKQHKDSPSLNKYIELYHPKKIYCLGLNNFSINDNYHYIPIYASYKLKEHIKQK